MSNSGTKWPEGYKGFVSAIVPVPPVLTLVSYTNSSVTLSWSDVKNDCLPISSYNIFQNGSIVQTVSYTVTNTTISGLFSGTSYSLYITSVSNTISSDSSNIITVLTS
jgi:hypothetical protein